jgi:hypothetical protein
VELILREVGAIAEHGINQHSPDVGPNNIRSSYGTNPTYTLKGLKRDHPELAERVIAGELPAPRTRMGGLLGPLARINWQQTNCIMLPKACETATNDCKSPRRSEIGQRADNGLNDLLAARENVTTMKVRIPMDLKTTIERDVGVSLADAIRFRLRTGHAPVEGHRETGGGRCASRSSIRVATRGDRALVRLLAFSIAACSTASQCE